MKYSVCICILLGLGSSSAYVIKNLEEMRSYREACAKELDVPSSIVSQFAKPGIPNDHKSQSYMKCPLTKFGMFDEQRGFNEESINMHITHGAVNHD